MSDTPKLEPRASMASSVVASSPPVEPRLRLVHAVAAWDVAIESSGPNAFWITRMRDHGQTSSGMLFTRAQLERLIALASAALENA